MGYQRIEDQLHVVTQRGEVGFIPYLTVGYPDVRATVLLVETLAKAGATIIELGIPFSDPLADGPTIQKASLQALQHGVKVVDCLDVVTQARKRGVKTPLVFMSYYNPLLAHGLANIAHLACQAGADGFIVPDLPTEESGPFHDACAVEGMALIPLLTPTSSPERVALGCSKARGFVYCVSVTGVTGARQDLAPDIRPLVESIRRSTSLPVAVGFGVSRKEHVAAVGQFADAAVVGSALIDVIGKSPRRQVRSHVQAFVAELTHVKKNAEQVRL
ncbi:MAG: tryptophan synthase subunit alpha [Dehalococcoidia bacterium]|nr:tryptophan synthase subunit alpha [Dehalococcoidia bacterium]